MSKFTRLFSIVAPLATAIALASGCGIEPQTAINNLPVVEEYKGSVPCENLSGLGTIRATQNAADCQLQDVGGGQMVYALTSTISCGDTCGYASCTAAESFQTRTFVAQDVAFTAATVSKVETNDVKDALGKTVHVSKIHNYCHISVDFTGAAVTKTEINSVPMMSSGAAMYLTGLELNVTNVQGTTLTATATGLSNLSVSTK
jgi:hypothetical protein